MKAICVDCKKEYEETDKESFIFIEANCPMICYSCSDLIKKDLEYRMNNQPERSKREDSTFLCNIEVKVDIPPDTKKWHEMMGCGALNIGESQ